MGAVSPVGFLSGAGSSSMGLGAGFHLLGHFRGPIPLAWVVYPGRWVVAVGRWAVLWVFGVVLWVFGVVLWAFSWAVSHNPRVAFAKGVGIGAVVVFDVAWVGWFSLGLKRGVRSQVDAANVV